MAELNKESPMPLWYQIKEILKDNIEKGKYSHGEPLPTEKQLCKEFDVSVITIRKPLDELVKEGVLTKQQGKGTFLKHQKFQRELGALRGLSNDIKAQGSTSTRDVLEFEVLKPRNTIAKKFNIESNEKILEIVTVTTADDVPVILTKFYLPKSIVPGLKKSDIKKNSIYDILKQKYNLHIVREAWDIEAAMASEYESKVLNIPKDFPVLLHSTIVYDDNNNVIMVNKGIIRGDMFKLSISTVDKAFMQQYRLKLQGYEDEDKT